MTNSINLLSKEEKAKVAAQMVIMDAINQMVIMDALKKRGSIPTSEMIAFMNSEVFMNAVKSYLELMK